MNHSQSQIVLCTATWLRGLIPKRFMHSPLRKPRRDEIDTLYLLLTNRDLGVIEASEARFAASCS